MSSFHFPIVPGRPLSESLSTVPPSFASYLRQGFGVLSGVPEKHFDVLIEQIVGKIDSPRLYGEERFAADLGLKDEDIGPLVAAVSLIGVALASGNESPENVVQASSAAKILNEADKPRLLEFTKRITQNRATLREAMRRSRVASRVLPALDEFETAVDVRPVIEKGHVEFSIPVVMVHIDTDAAHEEIWFQMSKSQLEYLLEKLKDTLRSVEEVEAWSNQKLTGQR